MGKRVYEVARELGLSTQEVIRRLNDAGVEVKGNFAVVDDPVYERVFGNGSGDAAPNGRPGARGTEAVPRRIRPPWNLSLARRALVYVLVAVSMFLLAAGVGAMAALVLRGDADPAGRGEPRPSEQQGDVQQARERGGAPEDRGNADRAQQGGTADGRVEGASQGDEGASRLGEAEYVSRVGSIQEGAVEVFLDSHDKLLHYDALTAEDIEEMEANEAALEEAAARANALSPPPEHEEQHGVFSAAVDGLHEAARTAHELANDPVAAAEIGFDGYDRQVSETEDLLRRSNEMLGRGHRTIGDPRQVSPELGAAETVGGSDSA